MGTRHSRLSLALALALCAAGSAADNNPVDEQWWPSEFGADDQAGSVYVTAWEDQYVVKKSGTSSSLGVSALGSISLPIGGSEESLVKVGVATVRDPGFYERFHGLLARQLPAAP